MTRLTRRQFLRLTDVHKKQFAPVESRKVIPVAL
jgi:hypothetical protein